MEYDILFPFNFDEIDPHNDNVDICIHCDNGSEYSVVVITPENLSSLMESTCKPYISPDFRFLVVKEITVENIQQLVSMLSQEKELLDFWGADISEAKK